MPLNSSTPIEYLKELVAFAKSQGLTHVKMGDCEFTIAPQSVAPVTVDTTKHTLNPLDLDNMPSDEDMLLWSAGGLLPSEVRKTEEASGT